MLPLKYHIVLDGYRTRTAMLTLSHDCRMNVVALDIGEGARRRFVVFG